SKCCLSILHVLSTLRMPRPTAASANGSHQARLPAWPLASVSGQGTSTVLGCDCRSLFDGFPEIALDVVGGDPGGAEVISPLELCKRCGGLCETAVIAHCAGKASVRIVLHSLHGPRQVCWITGPLSVFIVQVDPLLFSHLCPKRARVETGIIGLQPAGRGFNPAICHRPGEVVMVGYEQRARGALDHRLGVLALINAERCWRLRCELALLFIDRNHAEGKLRRVQLEDPAGAQLAHLERRATCARCVRQAA